MIESEVIAMKKMTAAVLAALLMSPLGTSFYAACEAASTDLRVSSASSQPLPPSPPPDGMPPQGKGITIFRRQYSWGRNETKHPEGV